MTTVSLFELEFYIHTCGSSEGLICKILGYFTASWLVALLMATVSLCGLDFYIYTGGLSSLHIISICGYFTASCFVALIIATISVCGLEFYIRISGSLWTVYAESLATLLMLGL